LLHYLISLVQNPSPAKLVFSIVGVVQPLVHLEYCAEESFLSRLQPQQLGVGHAQHPAIQLSLARPLTLSLCKEGLAVLAAGLHFCGMDVGVF